MTETITHNEGQLKYGVCPTNPLILEQCFDIVEQLYGNVIEELYGVPKLQRDVALSEHVSQLVKFDRQRYISVDKTRSTETLIRFSYWATDPLTMVIYRTTVTRHIYVFANLEVSGIQYTVTGETNDT